MRSRRERISPERVALERGRRRRTPGLRREEVAQLSAVGVTGYSLPEQARDIQVSVQVLDALARTLLLDTSERTHLLNPAGAVDPSPRTPRPSLTPALRGTPEQLEPYPACIRNSRYDIRAFNRTYGRLLCDLDDVPREDRNCMPLIYTNEQWRASAVDLEETARTMAAKFRASMAGHLAEPAWKVVLTRLPSASPEFREAWDRHEVVSARSKRKQIRDARVGLLTLDHTDLWLGPDTGPRMVTYVPPTRSHGPAWSGFRSWRPGPADGRAAAPGCPGAGCAGAVLPSAVPWRGRVRARRPRCSAPPGRRRWHVRSRCAG